MELKKKAIKGFGLFLAASMFSRALQFLSKVILAWFLLPKEFGLFAIGFFFISVLEVFRSSGFEQALIYTKKDAEKAGNTVFLIQFAISMALFAIIFLASGTIGDFFGKNLSEALLIKKTVQALSFIIIINSIGAVHAAFLEKKMEFKKRVFPDILSSLAYFAIAIALSAFGYGIWSIVIATIASSIAYNFSMLIVSPLRLNFKINRELGKEFFDYAKFSLQASIIGFAIGNLDVVVVGKLLSTEMLGFYSMATTVSVLLPANLSFAIGKVAFPAYSQIREEKAKVIDAFERSIKYVLLLFLPFMLTIIVLSQVLVPAVLGEKWNNPEMVIAMQILGIAGFSRIVGSTASPIIGGIGKPKIVAAGSLVQLLMLALLIVPLTNLFGIIGTALAVSASTVIVILFFIAFVMKSFCISFKKIAIPASKIFFAAIAMAVIEILAIPFFPQKNIFSLAFLSIIGAASFGTIAFLLERKTILELLGEFLPEKAH